MQTDEQPRIKFHSQLQIVRHMRSMNEPMTVQHFRETLGSDALPLTHDVMDGVPAPKTKVKLYDLLKSRVEENSEVLNNLFETHSNGLPLR